MAYQEQQARGFCYSVSKASSGLAFPFQAAAAPARLHLPCYLPPAD